MNKYILKCLLGLLLVTTYPAFANEDQDIDTYFFNTEEQTLGVHGLLDVQFKNDYITPRGLLVSNRGLTTQVLLGLELDVYQNPCLCLDNVAFTAGVWNDLWGGQRDFYVGSWNELDWYFGTAISFCKDWRFTANYIEFLSPPHHFRTERNAEFTLYYNDTCWGWPVVINPLC